MPDDVPLDAIFDQTVSAADTGPLVDFLREHPAREEEVADCALARLARLELWAGLLAGAALAEARAIPAAQVLAKLVERGPAVPWSELRAPQLRAIRDCLEGVARYQEARDVLDWLPPRLAQQVLGPPDPSVQAVFDEVMSSFGFEPIHFDSDPPDPEA